MRFLLSITIKMTLVALLSMTTDAQAKIDELEAQSINHVFSNLRYGKKSWVIQQLINKDMINRDERANFINGKPFSDELVLKELKNIYEQKQIKPNESAIWLTFRNSFLMVKAGIWYFDQHEGIAFQLNQIKEKLKAQNLVSKEIAGLIVAVQAQEHLYLKSQYNLLLTSSDFLYAGIDDEKKKLLLQAIFSEHASIRKALIELQKKITEALKEFANQTKEEEAAINHAFSLALSTNPILLVDRWELITQSVYKKTTEWLNHLLSRSFQNAGSSCYQTLPYDILFATLIERDRSTLAEELCLNLTNQLTGKNKATRYYFPPYVVNRSRLVKKLKMVIAEIEKNCDKSHSQRKMLDVLFKEIKQASK